MEMEKSSVNRLLPRHALFTFAIYRGTEFFPVGELRHQLDIHNDRYILKATRHAAELPVLLDSGQPVQLSSGKIGKQGLQPEIFSEEKNIKGGMQNLQTTFDWATQKLHFTRGGDAALPADAQDLLSFMYQLSQLPMNREIIPLSISDGLSLKNYRVEIVMKEDIDTPMGKLRALHLRKLHDQGDAYFEIWLGLEYRMLPVKFRRMDGSDRMIEEFAISGIRTAEE